MKFLCDACKTKYQIDDDKVAGKTVRMKCRKCEHLIEIRSPSATGSTSPPSSSVSIHPNTVPPPPASSAAKPLLRAPVKPPAPPRRPAPVRPLLAPATGQFRAQATPNPLKPVTQSLARPGVAPLKGRAPAPPRPNAPRALASPAERGSEPEQHRERSVAGGGSLQEALSENAAALDSLGGEAPIAHKWFVAIDGAAVGPLLADEVRQHIGSGKITSESLAWREGLGDWKQAAEIAELAALLRIGRPTSGVQARTPVHDAPSDDDDDPATVMQAVPDELVRAARAALDEPFVPAPAAFMPDAFSSAAGADPFAPAPFVDPASSPFAVTAAATASGIGASGAFHAGAEPITAAAEGHPRVSPHAGFASAGPAGPSFDDPFAAPHKKSPPWIPIAMLAAALAFGVTAAVVLFLPKPPPAPIAETKTEAPVVSARAPESDVPPPEPSTPVIAQVDDPKTPGTKTGGSGSSKGATAAPAASGAADLKGLLGGGGSTTGPSANGAGGNSGGGSGSLSQQQIEQTVQAYMPGVKRGCWDTSTARSGDVRAAITIAPSGSVKSVTSQSTDATLAHCIETKVRNWKFPPPGGSQVVTVPFKFLRQ